MSEREARAEEAIRFVNSQIGDIVEVAVEVLRSSDGGKAATLLFLESTLAGSMLDDTSMRRLISVLVLNKALKVVAGD